MSPRLPEAGGESSNHDAAPEGGLYKFWYH